MNAELGTSILLALAVVIWLSWLGSRVSRSRKIAVAAPQMPAAMRVKHAPLNAQEAVMTQVDTRSSAGAGSLGSGREPGASAKPASLQVHYGSLAIAGVGALALLAVPVTAIVRLFGAGSWTWPVVALVITAAAVAGLRALANRRRKQKVEQAFRDAMSTHPEPGPTTVPAKPSQAPAAAPQKSDAPVFDVQQETQQPVPLTGEQLRQAALAFADGAVVAEDGSWEPVQVPKPTYVEAAKAERPVPEPLQIPEQPKPSSNASIKSQEAAAKPGTMADDALADRRAANDHAGADHAGGDRSRTPQNNLDDVLQRRRA